MENPGKSNHFKLKTNEELEAQLNVYLTMDNLGGVLADDIIDELSRRQNISDNETIEE